MRIIFLVLLVLTFILVEFAQVYMEVQIVDFDMFEFLKGKLTDKKVVEKAPKKKSLSDRMLASSELFTALDSQDVDRVRTALENPNVDVNFETPSGAPIQRAVEKPETYEALKIVELILAHPELDPNGTPTAPPPLKTAIRLRHRQMVILLMSHAQTELTIPASGLPCDAIELVPFEVTLTLDRDAPPCYSKHPKTMKTLAMNPFAAQGKATIGWRHAVFGNGKYSNVVMGVVGVIASGIGLSILASITLLLITPVDE
jgi:hypothetical protein